MEKVQFQLEATLPELKDLHEKGLFSKVSSLSLFSSTFELMGSQYEINEITRRRTGYETSLIRQVTRKEDFFKYAEYEINLERLRRVRWKRLSMSSPSDMSDASLTWSAEYHLNPPPPSASTYSLPRRALYILKRATVKFSGDLAVWLAYVEYASRQGMRKVVSKGLNRLAHLHASTARAALTSPAAHYNNMPYHPHSTSSSHTITSIPPLHSPAQRFHLPRSPIPLFLEKTKQTRASPSKAPRQPARPCFLAFACSHDPKTYGGNTLSSNWAGSKLSGDGGKFWASTGGFRRETRRSRKTIRSCLVGKDHLGGMGRKRGKPFCRDSW